MRLMLRKIADMDDRGGTATEYALAAVLISIAAVAGYTAVASSLTDLYTAIMNKLVNAVDSMEG